MPSTVFVDRGFGSSVPGESRRDQALTSRDIEIAA
jgi:hypothetical protein